MNGTVIDIPGITVSVTPIELQDTTDKAHLITIHDGEKEINISIAYGKITDEKIHSSKHEQ